MKIIVFGIKNCNTMKKTFDFFQSKDVDYEFVDFKKTPPSLDFLQEVAEKLGLSSLINRSGTTYKKLSDQQKELLNTKSTAFEIIANHSSMIKRPLIKFSNNEWVIGFDVDVFNQNL